MMNERTKEMSSEGGKIEEENRFKHEQFIAFHFLHFVLLLQLIYYVHLILQTKTTNWIESKE